VERKVYARMMEVYAGFLEHTDYHIGRLLDFLKRIDALDNTLIIAVSDNGASSEGGPNGMININMWHNNLPGTVEDNLAVLDELGGPLHFNHFAWGWTFAATHPSGAGSVRLIAAASPIRSSSLACQKSGANAVRSNTFTPLTLCQRCSTAWASRRRRPSACHTVTH